MPIQSERLTPHDYVRVLRQHSIAIIAIVLLGAAAALGVALAARATYTADASVASSDLSQDYGAVGTAVAPFETPQALAAAGAQTATTTAVATGVKQELHSTMTVGQLRRAVTASVDQSSNLVVIHASAHSAGSAAAIANAFADRAAAVSNQAARQRFVTEANSIAARIKALQGAGNAAGALELQTERARFLSLAAFAQPATVVDRATPPSSPSSPKPLFDAVLGGAIALIIALLITFGRVAIDRRLGDPNEVEQLLDLPLIGDLQSDALGRSPVEREDRAALSNVDLESIRIIRRNLDALGAKGDSRTVAITSPLPEEGKSTSPRRWRSPRPPWVVARSSSNAISAGRSWHAGWASRRSGLADYLVGDIGWEEVLHLVTLPASRNGSKRAAGGSSKCILAGTSTQTSDELLGSVPFQKLLDAVSAKYDVVLLDSAPLLPVADALEIIPLVDSIVLCVRIHQTTRDQALAAKAAIQRFPARPTGLVVTAVRPKTATGATRTATPTAPRDDARRFAGPAVKDRDQQTLSVVRGWRRPLDTPTPESGPVCSKGRRRGLPVRTTGTLG